MFQKTIYHEYQKQNYWDYDVDGFQEVYLRKIINTASLIAVMHADGNIQYANYQKLTQWQKSKEYDSYPLKKIFKTSDWSHKKGLT